MTATHERLIRLLEQGRSDIAFESLGMKSWGEGWNASIDNSIKAIRLDAAYGPVLDRAARLASLADVETDYGMPSVDADFGR